MTTIVVIMEGFMNAKCASIPKGPGTLQKVLISIIISWEGNRFICGQFLCGEVKSLRDDESGR